MYRIRFTDTEGKTSNYFFVI